MKPQSNTSVFIAEQYSVHYRPHVSFQGQQQDLYKNIRGIKTSYYQMYVFSVGSHTYMVKVKVKFSLEQATKAQMGE